MKSSFKRAVMISVFAVSTSLFAYSLSNTDKQNDKHKIIQLCFKGGDAQVRKIVKPVQLVTIVNIAIKMELHVLSALRY